MVHYNNSKGEESKVCMRTIVASNQNLCTTFKAHLFVSSPTSGILIIDRLDFGGYEICRNRNNPIKRITLSCDYSKDSCGIRTDFCSLDDWTIQEKGNTRGRTIRESTGLPLLKKSITGHSCSYPICIPCFQRSGIDVTVSRVQHVLRPDSPISIFRGRRNLQGRSLYLDPSQTPKGPAVLNLPEFGTTKPTIT